MKPSISVIIPIYRESRSDLEALLAWIENESTNEIEWLLSIADDPQTLAALPSLQAEPAALRANTRLQNNWSTANTTADRPTRQPHIIVINSGSGRALQMNQAAAKATGEILVFLHADTRLGPGWSDCLIEALSSYGKRLWGAFIPQIESTSRIHRLAEVWGRWRTKYMGIPYGDQALFMHRRLFKNFDESVQFMEDVVMADTLAKAGIKLFMPDCRAITSARSWTGSRGHSVTLTLKHSFKNVLAFLLFKLGISRVKLKSWYTRF